MASDTDLVIIEDIAEQVREQLIRKRKGKKNPTANQCYEASLKIYEKLQDEGFEPKLIAGKVIVDEPNMNKVWAEYTDDQLKDMKREDFCNIMCRPLHYWIEVDGLIIDATGDQFNDELTTDQVSEVVIDPYEAQPRYIKEGEVEP